MARWCALGAERQNYRGPRPPNEGDNVARQLRRVCLRQLAVPIPRHLYGTDTEDFGRDRELAASHRGQFLARGNGDAGTFAGVPVGQAEKIDRHTRRRVFGDDPTDAKSLVVRMREDARDTVLQLSPTPTEQAEDEHEQI